jgi:4-diphosphocytidyl-2-C-methyl-D-erythritol kinase
MTGSGSAVFAPIAQSIDLSSAPALADQGLQKSGKHPLNSWIPENKL